MRVRIIFITLGMALIFFAVAQSNTNQLNRADLLTISKQSTVLDNSKFENFSKKLKSYDTKFIMPDETTTFKKPSTAFWHGFGPVFFIHGLGHRYVEDERTANVLFITEVASLSLIFIGAISRSGSVVEFGDMLTSDDSPQTTFIYAGTGLFLASWIYDFAHAPFVVNRKNREAKSYSDT